MTGRISALGALLASGALVGAAPMPGRGIAFVSCPIVRDTKTVPCWLAEHNGKTYYMGIQTDVSAEFNPPSLGHRVLVEGVPSDDPPICGGIVLKQVKVSVMQERAEDCNTMLPAEDRYDLPFESPRPPGPSNGRLAYGYPAPPPLPQPPYKPRSFDVQFEFNGMVNFQSPRALSPIVAYARLIKASRIQITGFRGATRLDDGTVFQEQADIGAKRANQMQDLLRGVGLTTAQYQVIGRTRSDVGDWKMRRVTVVVSP